MLHSMKASLQPLNVLPFIFYECWMVLGSIPGFLIKRITIGQLVSQVRQYYSYLIIKLIVFIYLGGGESALNVSSIALVVTSASFSLLVMRMKIGHFSGMDLGLYIRGELMSPIGLTGLLMEKNSFSLVYFPLQGFIFNIKLKKLFI